ncbi:phasin family protein [uncultured Sulfitobacter sp.]|uniref:phasin family protein n=1 Tax=uncultured Sulfitobacter sp. TaxID=191468 RepID=UPI002629EB77|nr:phasin family protein [uncultured Sulfitobacter sp.]
MTRKDDKQEDDNTTADPFAAFWSLTPTAYMSAPWFEVLTDMGTEISTFVTRRIKEDVEAQQALMQCRSPEEFQHVHAQFMQKAFDQYHEETGKLVELTERMRARIEAANAKKG